MKKKYLCSVIFFILLLESFFSGAQNLVSNCSFELHDTCPDNAGQIERATGWHKTYGNADYFNACSPGAWTVPPQLNYQLAATGNAFAGGTLFSELIGGIEVIHTVLTSPLTIGTTYYVSFKVNLCFNPAAFMNQAINKIGAKFTTGHLPLIDNIAQVYTNAIILDSVNWVPISGSFVADSAYTRLFIGVFFDTAAVTSVILASPSLIYRAYYFIDDVCVSANPGEVCSLVGIAEAPSENDFYFYPNPTTGELKMQYAKCKIENIEISDIVGKIIVSTNVLSFSSSRRSLEDEAINVSSLPPGIYFVTITDEKQNRVTKRFVKM